ncbi:MAG: SCO family protein [Acidobacteriota bacterium]
MRSSHSVARSGRGSHLVAGLAWLVAALAAAAPVAAQFGPPRPQPITSPDGDERPSATEGVDFEQNLGARVPMDTRFLDESGADVTLAGIAGGRPVLLVPAYYECPMLCNMVLAGVASSLATMDLAPGEDFELVVVSFDPEETPELARQAEAQMVARYDRPGVAAGLHFLTGDEPAIRAVLDAVGFRYDYVPERDEWAHAAGIVTLTPDGTVARYHYGVEYPPRDLRLALVEAGDGAVGSAVDQVLLYCLRYDPSTGRYSLAILNLVRAGGVLTVLAMVAFMLAGRRRKNLRPAAGES